MRDTVHGVRRLRSPIGMACAVLAVAALAVAPSPLSPTPADAAPPVVFGVGGWSLPTAKTLAKLHRAGLRSWRLTMSWSDVARYSSAMNFSGYDTVMRAAAANHVEMLVTLTGCPAWACPQGGPPRAPAALAQFRRFVRAAVLRYGHRGSLWGGHPTTPVVYWQVFNEVNGADQWPQPSPTAYARVLRATASTIRHADRRAKVVLAGLGEKMTIWLRNYLPALYRKRGFKHSFDVMAPEGYGVHSSGPARILTTTRRIMRRFHDTRKPLFITEMSWSTGGPPFPFITTPAGQARRLRRSWRQLQACRARWNLRRVYWFSYDDHTSDAADDYWGFHNGLIDLSLKPKPAFFAFEHFLRPRASARSAGRCHR